jgi:hypothetical protein
MGPVLKDVKEAVDSGSNIDGVDAPAFTFHHAGGGCRDPQKQFLDAVKVAVDRAAAHPTKTAVCVTHREGIRDIHEMLTNARQRLSTPYCCVGHVTVPLDENGAVEDINAWEWNGCYSKEEVSTKIRLGGFVDDGYMTSPPPPSHSDVPD